jgi:light-regulated signal transduction histidine kinase (bacteriophytochrome)
MTHFSSFLHQSVHAVTIRTDQPDRAGDPPDVALARHVPAAMERLFRPFTRGAVRPSQQGLGVGLFIASQVAKAHGGTLDVVSSPEENRFTFRMPLKV